MNVADANFADMQQFHDKVAKPCRFFKAFPRLSTSSSQKSVVNRIDIGRFALKPEVLLNVHTA
jgi:hypothetical protein